MGLEDKLYIMKKIYIYFYRDKQKYIVLLQGMNYVLSGCGHPWDGCAHKGGEVVILPPYLAVISGWGGREGKELGLSRRQGTNCRTAAMTGNNHVDAVLPSCRGTRTQPAQDTFLYGDSLI